MFYDLVVSLKVGKKVLGFKSVDSWEGEVVDGIISKKQVSRTRFEDVKSNFNRRSVGSFW